MTRTGTTTTTSTSTSTSAEGSKKRKCGDRTVLSTLSKSYRPSPIDTTGKSTRSVFSENEISAGIRRRREKLLQRQREWIVLLNRIAERRNMARGHALAISLPVCCRHFHIFENWGDSHSISPPDGISAPARLLSHNGEICRKPFWIHLVTRGRNSRRIS